MTDNPNTTNAGTDAAGQPRVELPETEQEFLQMLAGQASADPMSPQTPPVTRPSYELPET